MAPDDAMWMTLTFGGTGVAFLAMALVTLWHLRWVRRLPAIDELPKLAPNHRCSVVIAARNEEARIEQTVRRLLAQRGVELEIVIVDDRSTDGTSAILQRLATELPNMQVRRVDALPDGWLGKCHACHIGASTATSDWILFTDADCWLRPDVIERALRIAEREKVDHITLASGTHVKSPGLAASHLLFLLGTANWYSEVNRDTGKRYIGFGAFNLVRAEAYRQSGGYDALRLTVLDDVKLGLLMQRAGSRTRAFIGGDDVEAHWGVSAFSIVKIMEKNYFAALEYRTSLVVIGTAAMILLSTIVIMGFLSGKAIGLLASLSPLLMTIPGVVLARRLQWPRASALLIPAMFPIFHYALVNSAFHTLRRGGIRWRETFYPLDQLRAGGVR